MADLPLARSFDNVLDSSGSATIIVGPGGVPGRTWQVTNLGVMTTSGSSTTGETVSTLRYAVADTLLSVSNDATPNPDTALLMALEADKTYEVDVWAYLATTVACDVQTTWTVPTGATGFRSAVGATSNAATFTSRTDTRMRCGVHNFTTVATYQLDTSGNGQLVWERALVIVPAGVSGDVVFNWAQATPVVGNLDRLSSSFMRVQEVA